MYCNYFLLVTAEGIEPALSAKSYMLVAHLPVFRRQLPVFPGCHSHISDTDKRRSVAFYIVRYILFSCSTKSVLLFNISDYVEWQLLRREAPEIFRSGENPLTSHS